MKEQARAEGVKTPYAKPTLEKRQRLAEVVEGAAGVLTTGRRPLGETPGTTPD